MLYVCLFAEKIVENGKEKNFGVLSHAPFVFQVK